MFSCIKSFGLNCEVKQLNKELHPTIKEFKAFINNNSKLRADIRQSGRPWQDYYERWVLNGNDDPMWKKYSQDKRVEETDSKKQSELFNQLIKFTQNIDMDKAQQQMKQLDKTINSVQGMLNQFLEYQHKKKAPTNLLNLFRD